MNKKILIPLLFMFPTFTYAECINSQGENICALASAFVGTIQSRLPLKVNGVTITSITVDHTVVKSVGVFGYTKEQFELTANQLGVSPEAVLQGFLGNLRQQACSSSLRGAVEKGITLEYSYFYKDMTPYTNFSIESCEDLAESVKGAVRG